MSLNKKQTASFLSLAAAIIASASGFIYAGEKDVAPFVKEGFVEVNAEMKEGENVAVRLTEAGQAEAAKGNTATTAQPEGNKTVSKFAIEEGFEIPAGRARVGNAGVYPFEQLEVNQSFFVPNTEDKPNAAKSLASTVSSATRRFAEEVPGEMVANRRGNTVPKTVNTREFIVRPFTQPDGTQGARVWRTK